MFYYPLSALINGITLTVLGIFVFLRNRRGLSNITYAIFCVFISFWSYSYFLWQISLTSQSALFWCRMLMAGAIFIPTSYFHFVNALIGSYRYKSIRLSIIIGYILAFIFLVSIFTSQMIVNVRPILKFPFWPKAGPFFSYFLIYFTVYAIFGLSFLLKAIRSSTGDKRNQYIYIFIGSVLGYVGGSTNFPLFYGLKIYPVGNILSSIYVGLVGIAILRYRLMDISVALTRTSIFIAVYALVLGLPFAAAFGFRPLLISVLGAGWWWVAPLILMGVLATVGPFIYIYIGHKAEEKLLREQRRYQRTLKQASAGMSRIRDLNRLLNLIADIVTKPVEISSFGIYLYNQESDKYLLQVSRNKGRMPILKLASDNPLAEWLKVKSDPLVHEEIKRLADDVGGQKYKELDENMRMLGAAVIIPSYLEDKFMGFFVLGEKLSGKIYTPEDLSVFQILASQAALAIENAQFYEETKQMQEQIAQAEKMATVGVITDGLSHQINNRFSSLALLAGDTIDAIKMADTTACTPEIRDMISDINRALQRIQSNVIQGGQVVKGILKYTRKGEENFEALTLDQVLDGTLEMVQYKVKLSEIDLIRDYPKDTPKISGNGVQLQEAFFNFIDNAYDAIVERRTTLGEDGYRGKITVSARPRDGILEVVVSDNGMGVKEDNIKKVFTPFFTTKISARKGTGLGLYVIRRIITDTHKGKIIFESKYKEGTRFILELPVAK